jgi:osmoprotectant transport system ATP-binding protein
MITLHQVSKAFGAIRAVDKVSLQIKKGEFTVLIGASGSGKSTLLRLINRLVEADSGRIEVLGADIRNLRPEDLRRRMGYVIQSIGLFPHWTVAKNIATVPRLLGWPAARTAERVAELLSLLGLPPAEFAQRWPHQLSGGQQQRVGVARALAADPELLLMDEPFGALDPVSRSALQQALARIHRATGKTIVMVTHDIDEALQLAGRIVLLDQGRVVQADTPTGLLTRPATAGVSEFIGRAGLGLKLLALQTVADRTRRGELPNNVAAGSATATEPLRADLNLRDALSAFVLRQTDRLPVVDAQGQPLGMLHVSDLLPGPP